MSKSQQFAKNSLQIIVVLSLVHSLLALPSTPRSSVRAQSSKPPWLDEKWRTMGYYVHDCERGIPILVPIFSIVVDISTTRHNQLSSIYLTERLVLLSVR